MLAACAGGTAADACAAAGAAAAGAAAVACSCGGVAWLLLPDVTRADERGVRARQETRGVTREGIAPSGGLMERYSGAPRSEWWGEDISLSLWLPSLFLSPVPPLFSATFWPERHREVVFRLPSLEGATRARAPFRVHPRGAENEERKRWSPARLDLRSTADRASIVRLPPPASRFAFLSLFSRKTLSSRRYPLSRRSVDSPNRIRASRTVADLLEGTH